jgi:phasin family protein
MATQSIENIVTFSKDNVDAIVQSGTVAVKGLEELAKTYASLANHSIEQTTSAVKALTSVKSPTEFQTVYSSLVKSSLESLVAESRKLQELTTAIVNSSVAPLNERVHALSSLFKAA